MQFIYKPESCQCHRQGKQQQDRELAAIYVDAEIWQNLNLTTQHGTNKNLVGQILGSGKQVTIHLGNND